MNLKYKIKNRFYDLKWRIQRFKRGYADVDVWNLDSWFLNIMRDMLNQLIHEHHGYPTDMTVDEWEKILVEMQKQFAVAAKDPDEDNEFFDKLDYDFDVKDDGELIINHDDEMWDSYMKRCDELSEVQKKAQAKALKMFVKYFENLWD